MDLQVLLNQLGNANNPMAMMMGLLNPQQKQMANIFQKKNKEEQYEEIAKKCNELGISKEQLQGLIGMFTKR